MPRSSWRDDTKLRCQMRCVVTNQWMSVILSCRESCISSEPLGRYMSFSWKLMDWYFPHAADLWPMIPTHPWSFCRASPVRRDWKVRETRDFGNSKKAKKLSCWCVALTCQSWVTWSVMQVSYYIPGVFSSCSSTCCLRGLGASLRDAVFGRVCYDVCALRCYITRKR